MNFKATAFYDTVNLIIASHVGRNLLKREFEPTREEGVRIMVKRLNSLFPNSLCIP